MNLLDILSSGKRSLSEENVSSLLAWLLDPSQSHGCGPLFLKYTLAKIDADKFKCWLSILPYNIAYRKSEEIKVNILVEQRVTTEKGNNRDIDIVITLENETETHIIAIENKIRELTYDTEQLIEEYNGLKRDYPESTISFLYLTPKTGLANFAKAFKKLPDDITKKHMTWTKGEDQDSGFTDILRQVLREDDEARITPLSQEMRFVLKSFIIFAENGFQPKINELSNSAASKFFKDVAAGLSGLQPLIPNADTTYIGFVGGIKALENASFEYLENRPFKWDDNLNGKISSNWIRLSEFKQILEKRNLWTF